MTTQTEFGLRDYLAEEGRLLIMSPSFDFDSYEVLGDKLVSLLSASVVEKQWDADMHSWLIDFEGCRMFLKSEHYSESIWFESLNVDESKEEFDYLAQLFRSGF